MRKFCFIIMSILLCSVSYATEKFITLKRNETAFHLISNGKVVNILYDFADQKGIGIALNNLIEDFNRICGMRPALLDGATDKNCIIVGSLESKYVRQLIKSKKLDKRELQGKNEKYVITTVDNPLDGVDKALVIAGSDRRGTIYG